MEVSWNTIKFSIEVSLHLQIGIQCYLKVSGFIAQTFV